MSAVTFIDAPFLATHRSFSGGDIQVLGIGTSIHERQNVRQVMYWNRDRELFMMPLEEFMRDLPDGRRRFLPLTPATDLLSMINAPIPRMKGVAPSWRD